MGESLSSKTPVSLLHEICTRNNVSPKYDLLQIEGAIHEPIFQYRLTLDYNGRLYEETGTGRSKKEAKHNTARAMLRSMEVVAPHELFQMGGGTTGNGSGADSSFSGGEDGGSIHSGDGDPGNPVGILQELCMKMKYPPPTYEVHSEEGLPHERLFAIACKVGDQFVEIGKGKSKKLAKRTAAHNMARKIKSLPLTSSSSRVFEDDDDIIIEKIRSLSLSNNNNSTSSGKKNSKRRRYKKSSDKNKKSIGDSSGSGTGDKDKQDTSGSSSNRSSRELFLQSCDYKGMSGPLIDSIRDPAFSLEPQEQIPFLKKLGVEQGFEAMYIMAEEPSRIGLEQCMLQITTDPPIVLIGEGPTIREAKRNAAEDGIRFLKQMAKRHSNSSSSHEAAKIEPE